MEPRTRWEASETVTMATRCDAPLFYSLDVVITAPSQARGGTLYLISA